jgi:hypothetical protein
MPPQTILVECRVLLNQDTVAEVHKLGGSLQYAIEDGLRVWLYAAHRKQQERSRRSLAAKKAALTRQQRRLAKHIHTRDDDGRDIIDGHPRRPDTPLEMIRNWA